MSLLEVRGLCKTFRRKSLFGRETVTPAVKDVDFDMERGKTLAIVGESGAGKSTTARLVLRLIEPDAGSIVFGGRDLMKVSPADTRRERQHMQMIFQDPYDSLDPRIPIGRSVSEPMLVHFGTNRSDRERRAVELLRRVGLGTYALDRLPHQLSGGQLQRVSIARALSVSPQLIVCDEAVAALDVSIRAQVLNLLTDIQQETGVAFLFIAHDLAIVEAFADDVIVMKNGEIMEAAPARELFSNPTSPYSKELLSSIPNIDPAQRRVRQAESSLRS